MNSFYDYRIFSELGLIVQYHEGDVTIEPLTELKTRILADPEFDPSYHFIIEFRRANVAMSLEDIDTYRARLAKKYAEAGIPNNRYAVLSRSPRSTAMALSFTSNPILAKVHYETFSTLEAAMDWMGYRESDLAEVHEGIEDLHVRASFRAIAEEE